MKILTPSLLTLGIATATLSLGCTSIRERAETSGTNRVTTIQIQTVFDAKAVVDKIRASNGATHNLGAQGVSEESTTKALENVAKGIVEGFIASQGGGIPSALPKPQTAIVSQDQIDEAVKRLFPKPTPSTSTNQPPK